MKYGDILEYIDGTHDIKITQAIHWCADNQATFDELLDKRVQKDDGLHRFFQINKIPEYVTPIPTKEEIIEQRAERYSAEVDPITSHIARLRDEEQTPEVQAEINALIAERSEKVAEIQEELPYPAE